MSDDGAGATLRAGDKELPLPLVKATEGNDGYDVSKLLKETGNVTLDTGFVNTASCTSAITYIDGDEGILRYRGYPIEQLAEKSCSSRSPTCSSTASCRRQASWRTSTSGSAGTRCSTRTSRRSSPASRATRTRCRCCPRRCRRCRPSTRTASTRSTRSRSRSPPSGCWPSCRPSRPTRYKKSVGQPFLYPDNSLSLTENFLRMTFGFPAEPYEIDPTSSRRSTCCSSCTPTTSRTARRPRCVWSAPRQANLFASISAGINALFGPLHGGANQAVLEMLRADQGRRRRRRRVHQEGQEQGGRCQAHGLRAPRLQELRPARGDHQEDRRHDPQQGRRARRAARDRPAARAERPRGRLLRRAQALPERGLLHRPDLQGDGLPDPDVHRAVRPRPAARAGSPSGAR